MASTIETCKEIPNQISLTGNVILPRNQINMQIGELFSLRIDIHLNGSVLDTPEVFWVEPHLEPVYQAVRSYLEMDQRVSVLTDRLDVIADLLAVLKDLLSHRHGEKLEWIGESSGSCTKGGYSANGSQLSFSLRRKSWWRSSISSLISTLASDAALG